MCLRLVAFLFQFIVHRKIVISEKYVVHRTTGCEAADWHAVRNERVF